MNYKETVDWLFQQFPAYQKVGASAYKPDLYNVSKLCAAFNNPQNDLKFIHVAGTNGKGSTSSYIASTLTESGFKTGLFTSPHIKSFTERIRINGIEVEESFVVDFVEQIQSIELNYKPSFFEMSFVMALVYFKKNDTNLCVIETGLGGRLDATNIISPILSVITNIGLEHTNFLGTTLEEIAGEKAGIIKKKTPVVIGEFQEETLRVFKAKAEFENSQLTLTNQGSEDFFKDLVLGEYLQKNLKTALSSLEILVDLGYNLNLSYNFRKGIQNVTKNTGLKARMQILSQKPLTILDCAHNYDGIQAFFSSVKEINKGDLKIVYGTSSDKDLIRIFELLPKDATYFFTTFKNERTAKIEDLMSASNNFNLKSTFYSDVKEAKKNAQNSANENDTILIFGSFFLLDDLF